MEALPSSLLTSNLFFPLMQIYNFKENLRITNLEKINKLFILNSQGVNKI